MLVQLSTNMDILQIEAEFQAEPLALFRYWVEPALLAQWWSPQAESECYEGGAYHLAWPQRGWHLRGRYSAFVPGKQLSFTWQWDHESAEADLKNVEVLFEGLASGGTRLLLTHGPYRATPEDQARRIDEHLAGWMHFLACLQQVVAQAA
ncbi:MAG TPA: SRPBCC domain-containing protein [Ktedonobacteraceae bacterium]